MQVVRLVKGGQVDKIIAFDSLPERLVKNVEFTLVKHYKMPRYWEKFAEKHYVLEYDMINKDKEAWQAITNFLKQAVDKTKVTLMDKIEEMAIPMAPNSKEPLSIEPEDIPVIPIPEQFQEKPPVIEVVPASAAIPAVVSAPAVPVVPAPAMVKCGECDREFMSKQAVRMHSMKKHSKQLVTA